MLPGIQAQQLLEAGKKGQAITNQKRSNVDYPLLKFLLGVYRVGNRLQVPLECLVPARFGIDELRFKRFDLVQYFLP